MTGYSEVLLDHFNHPRNVGELEDATATAEGDNPVCGDRLLVQLRIDDDIITGIRWRADACPPTIAAASCASGLLSGKSVAEARRVDCTALTDALGGIPARKSHAPALVADTIRRALDDYSRNSAREVRSDIST